LIVAILVVNNARDLDTDRVAGKMTLAVLLGRSGAHIEYFLMLVGAYLAPFLLWVTGLVSAWALLSWLSAWFAYRQFRSLLTLKGRPLNQTLAGTGQLVLFFGILYSLGLVIEKTLS
jgi:1,4-dihydroxy-2-naphthoate octaprenyltransferase